MFGNRYLLARLLEDDSEDLNVGTQTDELALYYLDYVPSQFFTIWTREELVWARDKYHDEEFTAVRRRFIEIERQLEHEPRGERRSRLVQELSGLREDGRRLRSV